MFKNMDGNKACILVTASLAFVLAMILLVFDKFTGSDFVLFMTTLVVMTLVIWCLPKISEFSIAGNTVKLKETLSEAEKITKDLKVLRRFSMKQFLNNMNIKGGNNHEVMRRFFNFISTYNELVNSKDLVDEFRFELIEITETLLMSCCNFVISSAFDLDIKETKDVRINMAYLEKLKKDHHDLKESEKASHPGIVNAGCFAELSIILDDFLENINNGEYVPVAHPSFNANYFNIPAFRMS
ncbi:hypothetical protein [Ewingella americana]|nr:hypothetical protein [Ewingella americana]KAA8727989.1 hypothetical protein F4W05_10285 [Ewingella americana]STQ46258.1 Uncharacterised protein [Ewingella americana]